MSSITLGQEAPYPEHYDAALLQGIPRAPARQKLLPDNFPAVYGKDYWTAFEVSWLDARGKPQVRIGEFAFPSDSACIVESKSFKYYLNSFNETRFDAEASVRARMVEDLSAVAGATVEVDLFPLQSALHLSALPGRCIDDTPCEIDSYSPNAALLRADSAHSVTEQLYSHLLKSNCPVTGQPDWATLWLDYSGPQIDAAALLRYLISYRRHQDFHESCVETIYRDLWLQCQPSRLCVYARYTRRGGLDINPFRSSEPALAPTFGRLQRQ